MAEKIREGKVRCSFCQKTEDQVRKLIAVVGGAKCIIFIWIGFLILTLLCDTTIGKQGMALVEQDTVLNFLYNQNIFVKVFMSVFYGN